MERFIFEEEEGRPDAGKKGRVEYHDDARELLSEKMPSLMEIFQDGKK